MLLSPIHKIFYIYQNYFVNSYDHCNTVMKFYSLKPNPFFLLDLYFLN